MTTPDYTKKMSDLRTLVGQHVKLPSNMSKSTFIGSIPSINTQSPIFYIIPTLILVIIFMIIKPEFLCDDHIDKYNVITHNINYKTLFIYGLIGGGVISIGLFGYFSKR
jgi:hypothetical protein